MPLDLTLRLGDILNMAGIVVGALVLGSRIALRIERRFAAMEKKLTEVDVKVSAVWGWFVGGGS